MRTFEEVVLHLIEQANALWVEMAPQDPEEYALALSNNVTAQHLLNRALTLTNRKVWEIRHKYPKTHFPWNALMMYSMSWELIPGVHSAQRSFTPFEAERSVCALEASLREQPLTLFTGGKGQGKTLLARYTTERLFKQTIYVDCRQDFNSSELADLISELSRSVVVLDAPSIGTVSFVRDVVSRSPTTNSFCIISSDDDPCLASLTIDSNEVRLEDPTEFEIWRLRQRFATSFHSTYSDLPPCEVKNRAAIVRSIQNYILRSMVLWGKLQTVDREDPQKPACEGRTIRTKGARKSKRGEKHKAVRFAEND